jgi:TPR repeat protein
MAKRLIAGGTAAACLVLLAGAAWADMDTAMLAYTRGDYATAVNELRNLTVQGDSRAQYWLGFMYTYGYGVQQDQIEANRWYKNAAEHGYALAQLSYGYNVEVGQGT